MGRRRKQISKTPVTVEIEKLSHEGRGIARIEGKTVFVHGALPGERVVFQYCGQHRKFDEGSVLEVLRPSPHRVTPRCRHFDICGGCSLQHLSGAQQIRLKQELLLENLERIGRVKPSTVLQPLTGPVWGYRNKARLGVRYVIGKKRVLVGFRERQSRYLADMQSCEVLHSSVGERIGELAVLINGFECRAKLPQIEVAVDDSHTALVFRNLEEFSEADSHRLIEWAKINNIIVFLQPKGPASTKPLWPKDPQLAYTLDEYGVEIQFLPNDFTQVNPSINKAMISRAIDQLELQSDENLIEFFCGLGNFSLPFARRVASVTAIEGDAGLVTRGQENAEHNSIENVRFISADLAGDNSSMPWLKDREYQKVFLDPPRSGALELLPVIAKLGASRIVYVSCNPASLARDAGELVNNYGYQLIRTGIMDMFPHTAHVESIAVFAK